MNKQKSLGDEVEKPLWLEQTIQRWQSRTPSPEQITALESKLAPWLGPGAPPAAPAAPPSTSSVTTPRTPTSPPTNTQPAPTSFSGALAAKLLPWVVVVTLVGGASWMAVVQGKIMFSVSVPSPAITAPMSDASLQEPLPQAPPPEPLAQASSPEPTEPVANPTTASAPPPITRVARAREADTNRPEPPVASSEAPIQPSEVELLQSAQALATSRPLEALKLCQDHERRFPGGLLTQEREVLLVTVLLNLGKPQAALARGTKFLSTYPTSVHRRRVEKLIETAQAKSE